MTAAKAPRSDSDRTGRSTRTFVIGDAALPAATLNPGLYVVATPIGNLRRHHAARSRDPGRRRGAILAEDTRVFARAARACTALRGRFSPYHERHNAAEARPASAQAHRRGARRWRSSPTRARRSFPIPAISSSAEAIAQGFAVTVAPGPSVCARGALRRRPADRPFLFRGIPAASPVGAAGAHQRAGRRPRHAGFLRGPGTARRDAGRSCARAGDRPAAVRVN